MSTEEPGRRRASISRRFVDPFSPNRPLTDPERFAGRRDQVDAVVDALYQTAHGIGQHTILTGDRGIGKSSLLQQAVLLAEGQTTLVDRLGLDLGLPPGRAYNFAVGMHETNPDESLPGLVDNALQKFQSRGQRLLSGWKLTVSFKDYVKAERELGGGGGETLSKLVDATVEQLTAARAGARSDGIILFIDEIDRVSPQTRAATFFKLVSEELARADVNNVAFFLAGITGAIQRLEEEHASIVRVFRDIPLPRLSLEETREILVKGCGAVGVVVDEAVVPLVHRYAVGRPEAVHLFGSTLLRVSENWGTISQQDVSPALDRIVSDVRRNWLHNRLVQAGGGKNQAMLQAMAGHEAEAVPVDVIARSVSQTASQIRPDLRILTDRGVIELVDDDLYSFCEPLLREFIVRFGVWGVAQESTES
jgi:hypothetical protein